MSQEMSVFVAAAERGSFTAAAKDAGLTPSAVSRLIARLEDRLGTRLLHRTTRRLALTPAGETYLQRAKRILADIAEAEADISARGTAPRGPLRINAGAAFANYQLMPALPEFLIRYPEIEPDIAITDRVVDLLAVNADVAIRTGRVIDPALVVRKVCDLHRVICAAPDYLKRRGTPLRPEDLAAHDCLTLVDAPALTAWPFRIDGEMQRITAKSRIRLDNAEALLRLGRAGAGIFRSADMLVGDDIRNGTLVPLLADCHHDEPAPLSAVYPEGRHRSPAVRAFIDFVVEKFAHRPWRIAGCGPEDTNA
ncbi:LysR family transcriptional regulator [Rhodobium gokarnense]|uniref:DNA-binding transcriptional LysR family regulator n=1 Tax=Rhodobium gokarnense TaxID=364296 RepID=A0ABT3H9H1_9HYPH|nr:LysR family transcriptional regulator [Rhodobium gokarnense]MCW2307045.1 DNA-binding transcriptional LysR family regulator [Rhodobium gokarnense]